MINTKTKKKEQNSKEIQTLIENNQEKNHAFLLNKKNPHLIPSSSPTLVLMRVASWSVHATGEALEVLWMVVFPLYADV